MSFLQMSRSGSPDDFSLDHGLDCGHGSLRGWLCRGLLAVPAGIPDVSAGGQRRVPAVAAGPSAARTAAICQSDRIASPLTFGVLHPVILMPKGTDWKDGRTLQYVLEHEFVHILRFDTLSKLLLIGAVCVHWFNPMVWVLYILANRDLELSCNETVVRRFAITSAKTQWKKGSQPL